MIWYSQKSLPSFFLVKYKLFIIIVKITVEKYLIEIARYYNVEYEPDPQVMNQDEIYSAGISVSLCTVSSKEFYAVTPKLNK